jgi:4-hydroxy-3-methylbut-2-enyl diphosphate reductase
VILIGHAGHAQVEGTLGQIDGPVRLVKDVAEVEALNFLAEVPLAYITQTTLSVDDTRSVIAALTKRFSYIVGPDTRDICYATQSRQTATRKLGEFVDLILVVGDGNSSNTNRLREIGRDAGVRSYLVADGHELQPDWFKDARVVGITAGASAPEVLVEQVIDRLRSIVGEVYVSLLQGKRENVEFRLPKDLAAT